MAIIDPATGVTLIGRSRTWKQCAMVPFQKVNPLFFWVPANERVGKAFPHGLFMLIVQGMRSDDLPCQVTAPVDGRMFRDPSRLGMHIAGAWQILHSYLDCECQVGKSCEKHGTVAGGQGPVNPVEASVDRPS